MQRIFRYATAFEYPLQGIAAFAAVASGAGIALQNLIFGGFVTLITDYASGVSSAEVFLDDVGELAYVLWTCQQMHLADAEIGCTLFTLASADSSCRTFTMLC